MPPKGLSDLFQDIRARWSQNWCAVVVDSVIDRIQLQRILVADDDAASERLADLLMESSELVIESEDVHLAALVTGESYVIAWPDEETGIPEAYYNDSRNVHLFYEADQPQTQTLRRQMVDWRRWTPAAHALLSRQAGILPFSTNAVTQHSYAPPFTNEVSNGKGFVHHRHRAQSLQPDSRLPLPA